MSHFPKVIYHLYKNSHSPHSGFHTIEMHKRKAQFHPIFDVDIMNISEPRKFIKKFLVLDIWWKRFDHDAGVSTDFAASIVTVSNA